jgi:Ca2+-binding RTX toxin-like protein
MRFAPSSRYSDAHDTCFAHWVKTTQFFGGSEQKEKSVRMEGERVRMRGVVAWLVLAGLAILLTSGVALANKPIDCPGGLCDGTAKDDTMHGTADPDDINARRGDDGVYGLGSEDFLYGRRGGDTLQAGSDDDALYGDFGNDKLRGGAGADVLRGDDDFEQYKNMVGRDRLFGGNGADELYGYYGDDKLVGGEGNDIINAHDEPPSKWEDDIDCGPGRDTVYFDKGFDKLRRFGINCEVKKPISG